MFIRKTRALLVAGAVIAGLTVASCASEPERVEIPTGSPENIDFAVPSNVNAVGAIAVGANGSAIGGNSINSELPRVEVILDPQCPWCALVEEESSDLWNNLIETEQAQFYFTIVSFLDNMSLDQYSSKAGSAMLEVSETDPENFMNFMQRMFANQPIEGGEAESADARILRVAEDVGVSEEALTNIPEYRFQEFVIANQEYVGARTEVFPESLRVPTVVIGGELKESNILEGFTQVNYGDFSDPVGSFTEVFEDES